MFNANLSNFRSEYVKRGKQCSELYLLGFYIFPVEPSGLITMYRMHVATLRSLCKVGWRGWVPRFSQPRVYNTE